jgi:AcrR family transcriptional regulator
MATAGMRLPADQRRRQLLDVAREVFAHHGFHATSMDEVAEAAGVTKPVLYQHFPSKRALYVELLHDTGAQMLEGLQVATTRATTGRARVEAGFEAYFRFVVGNRAAFRVLFGASIRNDPEFAAVVDGVVRAAADAISTLIDIPASDEHRRVLAHALAGMAEAVGRRAVGDDAAEDDARRLAGWVAELAWFGLRGVRAEDPPSELP